MQVDFVGVFSTVLIYKYCIEVDLEKINKIKNY